MERKITIIGAGPAGYLAALKAAKEGFKVTVIEKDEVGGTCLNRGCIPTKALLHVTSFLDKNYERMGIKIDNLSYDITKMAQWKKQAVLKAVKGIEMLFKNNGVNLIKGFAKIIDGRTVEVNGERIISEHIIIATGSEPMIPGFIGKNEHIWTSDEALELKKVPQKMIIIGGGVIGLELATIYRRLGSEIVIFDILDSLGGDGVDEEIAHELKKNLEQIGIKIKLGTKITKVENAKVYTGEEEYEAEIILIATGRKALYNNVSDIEIIANNNKLLTDKNYQTNEFGVYAIGDVIDGPMLAHKAYYDAVNLINYLAGKKLLRSVIPSVIYTHPEIASCGLNEKISRERYGDDIKISKFPFSANPRANCTKELKGFVKLISNSDKIIGVHIMGESASELIWGFVPIINFELKAKDLNSTVFAHPTFSESIKEAISGLNDEMLHI